MLFGHVAEVRGALRRVQVEGPGSVPTEELAALAQFETTTARAVLPIGGGLAVAGFAKFDPRWVLERPHRWGRVAALSGGLLGAGALAYAAVYGLCAQQCAQRLAIRRRD